MRADSQPRQDGPITEPLTIGRLREILSHINPALDECQVTDNDWNPMSIMSESFVDFDIKKGEIKLNIL